MGFIKYSLIAIIICYTILSCSQGDNSLNKGVLIDEPSNYVQCGVVSNLVALKFRELNSEKEYILFIPCPELYGSNFFLKDQVYYYDTVKNREVYKDYILLNQYKDENLNSYFVDNIKRINIR